MCVSLYTKSIMRVVVSKRFSCVRVYVYVCSGALNCCVCVCVREREREATRLGIESFLHHYITKHRCTCTERRT